MSITTEQRDRVAKGKGFIAALDQSGGSTPKALKLYGVDESEYSNDKEMFELVHKMRERIVSSPAFNGDRVLGAILFEVTLDGKFQGKDAAQYLWEEKKVVPFLKIDKGLEAKANGVQMMKPIPGLKELLARAKAKGVFGTKERSVVFENNEKGISDVLDQQFALGEEVLAAGLVPIIEPEVDINSPGRAAIEETLKKGILARLEKVSAPVILKLTIPEKDGAYDALVAHPKVLKVVALSGGFEREEANRRLARNKGIIASFSRALSEGLSAKQSDAEFNKALDQSIQSIYEASIA
ncbi:fructose bisphosphate aldolase [Lautropia mirabilis]|uniref:fructose bisphosphate aldolase n=1 Tax=Lautropia mirabilis TaxID=47671 RepID=UPI0028D23CEB|nr:fructose bisphosphate aldolase [Lautropia mirabilis]